MIQSVNLSAPGTALIQLDTNKNSLVGLLVNVSNGATFAGEVDVAGSPNGPWNPHDTLQNLVASANGNVAYPVAWIRLNAVTLSGGTVTLTAIQKDTP